MRYIFIVLIACTPFTLLDAQTKIELILDYDIDVTRLNANHSRLIDSFMLLNFDSTKRAKLKVVGSADFLGSIEYNQKISDARVDGVVKYLRSSHFQILDTLVTQSEGELDNEGYEDEAGGVQKHRTVTISSVSSNNSDAIDALEVAEAGDKVLFRNLNFQPGRHYLLQRSIPELKRLQELLADNPTLKIEIHGHVCCVDFNDQKEGLDIDTNRRDLSVARAKNIYEYLIHKGIAKERLHYRGFGSSRKLIYPEVTEEDKTQNRRVEILVVER